MSREVLLGQRFGKLVIVDRSANGRHWVVQCDCGRITHARIDHLREGKTKTCGCRLQDFDITGQRFGKLLIIRRAQSSTKTSAWLVRCDCGTERKVSRWTAVRGKMKACDCTPKREKTSSKPRVDYSIRFWNRVEKSESCWNWTGQCSNRGYGVLRVLGKNKMAHRLAWELTNGTIPCGMVVCHVCDNPLCCNPSHLFIGTQKDNIADCVAKKRFPLGDKHGLALHPERRTRGSRHARAKLSERDIPLILSAHASGDRLTSIARRYDVSISTIHLICIGKTWKHAQSHCGGDAC